MQGINKGGGRGGNFLLFNESYVNENIEECLKFQVIQMGGKNLLFFKSYKECLFCQEKKEGNVKIYRCIMYGFYNILVI